MTVRRKLTTKDKLLIVLRQARCPICGENLEDLEHLDFDHELALVNGGTDTLDNMRALHRSPCHSNKTHGPGGEKRITTAGSDTHIRDKTRDLAAKHTEFISRILGKTTSRNSENPQNPKPKSKFGKRSFPPAQRKGRASNYRRKGV